MSDLRQVRQDIRELLDDRAHDDGSWGPLFIRLAWHLCGTYDVDKKTGGSNGCTMRFDAEAQDPENAGLQNARDRLECVKEKHPWMSRADLWVLSGYVALEHMGGPKHIPFKTGRKDFTFEEATAVHGPSGCPFGDGAFNPCRSRLPAADLGQDPGAPTSAPMHVKEAPTINAVRNTFRRLSMSDRETVALIVLGHQFGRAHPNVSGHEHAWYGFDPTHWNVYTGGLGYLSAYTMGEHMFREVKTAADMALVWDPAYRQHLELFDRDRRAFAKEAVAAWIKLTELGCDSLTPELT